MLPVAIARVGSVESTKKRMSRGSLRRPVSRCFHLTHGSLGSLPSSFRFVVGFSCSGFCFIAASMATDGRSVAASEWSRFVRRSWLRFCPLCVSGGNHHRVSSLVRLQSREWRAHQRRRTPLCLRREVSGCRGRGVRGFLQIRGGRRKREQHAGKRKRGREQEAGS